MARARLLRLCTLFGGETSVCVCVWVGVRVCFTRRPYQLAVVQTHTSLCFSPVLHSGWVTQNSSSAQSHLLLQSVLRLYDVFAFASIFVAGLRYVFYHVHLNEPFKLAACNCVLCCPSQNQMQCHILIDGYHIICIPGGKWTEGWIPAPSSMEIQNEESWVERDWCSFFEFL